MTKKEKRKKLLDILEKRKRKLIGYIKDGQISIDQLKLQECKDDLDFAEMSFDTFNEEILTTKLACELEEVEAAILRIDDGTYGICDMCDENIGFKRLKAKPYAKYCVTCREIFESKNKE
ncbi:MAG: hypothetical protein B1H07_00655 [Campylobacteraceae bacterium 4484_166]|nr:MAG: hypothetical protein B1H07_00655 [Campylobacteraceae bacterium 4484_166]